ncbi:TetR family transcriptional regulator [Klebsiella pneumoniae]|nr:TetR family transcriptional regulator [Klebsiella pneumoniae]
MPLRITPSVAEQEGQQTETEATGAPQKHHYTLNQQVGSITFLSEAYRAFGDALFLSLAETTIEFASHDPQRAREIIALGFEAMWHALHEADA